MPAVFICTNEENSDIIIMIFCEENLKTIYYYCKIYRRTIMPKNTFTIDNGIITIMRSEWDKPAFASYREDYYEELSSHAWGLKNGYPNNDTLGGGLHRYMMAKWYGEDVLAHFTAKGYVVDHMNNNHMDCQITNLEFLKKAYNTAKGQAFDVDSRDMRFRIAVNIFKDFSTGCYQITIGCNDSIGAQLHDGKIRWVNDIKLLYNCDYSIVINDAENILRIYDTEGRIALSNNNACDVRINYAPDIKLTEEEKRQAFVNRDGKWYLIIGNGNSYLDTVHFDEGWMPPTNK